MKETSESSEQRPAGGKTEKLSQAGMRAMRNDSAEHAKGSEPIHLVHRSKEVGMADLRPNAIYEKNGYTYRTDAQSRPVEVSGWLKLKEGKRTPLTTEIGHMGREGDHGGHLIGNQFDGPSDAFNIRPQNGALNTGKWEAMEREWAKAREDHQRVWVHIDLLYRGESIRPYQYIVNYETGGVGHQRIFSNRAPIDS